jgi:hypothetical protein
VLTHVSKSGLSHANIYEANKIAIGLRTLETTTLNPPVLLLLLLFGFFVRVGMKVLHYFNHFLVCIADISDNISIS